jgi:hypothetical protein
MKSNAWQKVIDSMRNNSKKGFDSLDPDWIMCYNDGTRSLLLEHNHGTLDDVLQAFEDFCKGAGFVFDGFAIVDEDGIPVNGLNSLAKLESDDEDQTG